MNMTHEEKMQAAIEKADLTPDMRKALGNVAEIIASMVAVGAILGEIAATGYGAAAEAISGALIVAGAYAAGVDIVKGLGCLSDFWEMTRCDRAQSMQDIENAGKKFEQGVTALGAGLLTAVLTFLAARGAGGGKAAPEAPPEPPPPEPPPPEPPPPEPPPPEPSPEPPAPQGGGTPINGATRTVPLGFESAEQFAQATQELQQALRASGIDDATVGVRGSSVTGNSPLKGTEFGPQSDIDFFVESGKLTQDYRTSKNIPGFVHPKKLMADYPALQAWASKWSSVLGREVSPGGFVPGTVPSQPAIVAK
jgi:hypothetical protein